MRRKLSNIKDDPPPIKMHFIPATIQFNGVAGVEECFVKDIEKAEKSDSLMINSIRGRPLKGEKYSMPAGRVGLVFRGGPKPVTESTPWNLKCVGRFKELNYWNFDLNPSKNDTLQKTVSSLNIIAAVHQKLDYNNKEK